MVKVKLKDDSILEVPEGTSVLEVAKKISEGLGRVATAGEIDGKKADLRVPINNDCTLNILTFNDIDGKKAYWHTTSHILAQAVTRLYPNIKVAIGPAIEKGFYYDFDTEKPFTPEMLEDIEAEMKKIIKENIEIERFTLPRSEALELMKDEPYKVELLHELPENEEISFYKQGDFTDLCAGAHLMNTGGVKAIKLLATSGAYWRKEKKNKMLQRIYGISFPKSSELDEYVNMIEEAKKRDHRKLGKELELFALLEEGPGFPFFLPKGMVLKNTLIDYWRKIHKENDYVEISTPIMLSKDLWLRSGHWEHYKNNMYTTKIDEQDYAVKPMNCPGGMLAYKQKMRSYRDLPLKMGELGLVHRHEKSGVLHGLMRVRCFTQDDAHIFMTPEQITDEIKSVINIIDEIYTLFGFKYHVELSTKPEDSMGTEEQWEIATNGLKKALDEKGLEYKINEGDGAFYGPKIDFHLEDSIGRTWQCGTVQLDMQMPEKFELEYIGTDGEKHTPIMIHRVAYGSMERFIGILIEHFAGAFPVWLAPVQVKILPIADAHISYSKELKKVLESNGLRVELDDRNEKIGYKIRESQIAKIPYMLIIGEKEIENKAVGVRSRADGDIGQMAQEEFIAKIKEEIEEYKI
jgi:threonyl-tRNA synthetase